MTRLGIYRLGEWLPVIAVGLAAVALGVVGFEQCGPALACHPDSIGDALVRSLFLIRGGQSIVYHRDPNLLVGAQTLMYGVVLWAAIKGSVKLILRDFRHDMQLARARTLRGHVVVCGLGDTGLEVVRGLKRAGHKVVAITREDAATAIAQCDRLGVPVLSGDASRVDTLEQAGIMRARALVATTGSDATNLDIATVAARPMASRTTALLVRPEIRAPWLVDAMAAPAAAIFDNGALVHPLRTEEVAARTLLGAAGFVRQAGARPRIVLAGLGDLGVAILRHAALSSFALPGVRAEILCYDGEAETREAALAAAPWRQFLDLETRTAYFGQGAGSVTDWATIASGLEVLRPDAVIVALGDDDAALEAALGLREALDRFRWFATPVYVRTRQKHGLRELLGRMAARPLCPERLAGFGDLASVVAPAHLFDEEADRMARANHEVYLALHPGPNKPARQPWERLAERFRRSNRAFADHIPQKLRCVGLRLVPGTGPSAAPDEEEVETMAVAEHYRWSLDLLAAGWRRGTPRDEAARVHEELAPWEALTEETRDYNREMVRSIPRVAALGGLSVRRLRRIDLHADPGRDQIGPDSIALIEIDVADDDGWRAAEAFAETASIVLHAHGIEQAELKRLEKIEQNFPRAAAAVEASGDEAANAPAGGGLGTLTAA